MLYLVATMTTKNNVQNLIEQVGGIERAKQLNEMLQKHAVPEEWKISIINGMWHRSSAGFTHKELRTAIASHDEDHCEHEWNDLTSNGDKYRFLVCKHCDNTQNYLPLDDSRKFKVGDLVVLNQSHSQNRVLKIQMFHEDFIGAFVRDSIKYSFGHKINFRHATPEEIKAGHRIDSTNIHHVSLNAEGEL